MAMAVGSLVALVACLVVSRAGAGRVMVGAFSDFYPVVDDQYAAVHHHTPEVLPPHHVHPVEAPPHPLLRPIVVKSYGGEEQAFADYQDGVQRSAGGGYGGAAQEADYYSDSGKKGNSGHESSSGHEHGLKAQHKNQQDQGYYGDVAAHKSAFDDGRQYHGSQNIGRRNHNAQNIGTRGGHKKGHHTTGFTNSYHKDESGKKSEFYDSSNDEGDHYAYKGAEDAYAGQGADRYGGGHQNTAYNTDARGKQGQYGAGSTLEDSRGHKGDYDRRDYYDRQQDYGQKAAHEGSRRTGGYYDGGARHGANGGHRATAGFYGGGGHGGFY